MRLADFDLRLGAHKVRPLVIGGMGVNISTAELAWAACRKGGVGHISDAMVPFVSDVRFGTRFSADKASRFAESRDNPVKPEVKFDLEALLKAQRLCVEHAMQGKPRDGLILINVMEKLTMGAPSETLAVRLRGALDGGIDGVTLSAGLHTGSLALISDHPRFRDALIGIIVSSDRALKIFLRTAARLNRMPDYVIVEGPLAGGHLGFGEDWAQHDLRTIVRAVRDLLDNEGLEIPVIAAGGVFTGEDAIELIERGASGVQVATRFTVTKECGLPSSAKQAYFRAKEDDVVVNTVSPTGYLMRMLKSSPCLNSNVRPSCESFGFMLNKEGKCQYLDAYYGRSEEERARDAGVKEKICLCHHFSKFKCYTCGHNVFRLKDTSRLLPNGEYEILPAAQVIDDYLFGESEHRALPLLASHAIM